MNISRRQFLKANSLAWGALGINLFSPNLFQRRLLACDLPDDRKFIFVFQEGGNDGLNTLIPSGDSQYNSTARPTLYIAPNQAIDLGNGFAQLHPSLEPLMEIYHNRRLTNRPGPGNLAILHRVGYSGQSQSHFDSQLYWQNGVPGRGDLKEGIFYRHLARTLDIEDPKNAFVAASLSKSQMVALRGNRPFPHFDRASSFSLPGPASKIGKLLGTLPSSREGEDGKGLLGLYGGPRDDPFKPNRPLVHQTGELVGTTITALRSAAAKGTYRRENGALYPKGAFGRRLEEAAMLLKRTPVKLVGLTIGGWDTHANQGQLVGPHANLLSQIAQGFQALYRDLQAQWDNVVIVTMTEFGRSSVENGSRGTDHADSSVMFVAGGGVRGGVYNCDSRSWKTGDIFSERGRFVARRTDFRAIFGEIFTRHFRDDPALLDEIIPGYNLAAAEDPARFEYLNFLST